VPSSETITFSRQRLLCLKSCDLKYKSHSCRNLALCHVKEVDVSVNHVFQYSAKCSITATDLLPKITTSKPRNYFDVLTPGAGYTSCVTWMFTINKHLTISES
jgi:hypothetical protein